MFLERMLLLRLYLIAAGGLRLLDVSLPEEDDDLDLEPDPDDDPVYEDDPVVTDGDVGFAAGVAAAATGSFAISTTILKPHFSS